MPNFIQKSYRKNPALTIGVGAGATVLTILGLRKIFRPSDLVSPTFKKVGVTLPSGENVDIDQYNKKTNFSPDPLATKLFNEMKGASAEMWLPFGGGTREEAWKELYNLSDPVHVVSVYNAYNEIAKKKGEPHSLTQAIIDEYAGFPTVKSDLLTKLKTLGLT